MAIITDKKRNKYYINYKLKLPNGERKNVNIRNKDWCIEGPKKVSLRYMKSIEEDEIEKDKKAKLSQFHEGEDMSLEDFFTIFKKIEISQGLDSDTARIYIQHVQPYLYKVVSPTTQLDQVFTISNIDKFRVLITEAKLKTSTINLKLISLRQMVLFCKKRKLITRDMADDAMDLLELVKATNNEVTKHNFFEHGDEDFKKFLNTFENKDSEWKIPFLTMFYGALRIGEWLAIQKKDINFEESIILINKQVNMLGVLKNRVKNGEDKIVRLPKTFILELKQWIEDRQFGDNDFIFQNNNTGKPYSRYFISNLLKNHLKEAGLEGMTPHGLRHSFATRMFDKGYDVKEVQEQLGHKNMNTTMNYYIHYTKNKHKKDLDDLL